MGFLLLKRPFSYRFEPTYEELKRYHKTSKAVLPQSFEPTYEELKREFLQYFLLSPPEF